MTARRRMIFGAVLALTGAGCSSSDKEPIHILAAYDLHQDISSLDVPSSHGAELAADDANARGGVLGRRLEVTILDTTYDLATTQTRVAEAIATGQYQGAIGFSESQQAIKVAPDFEAAQVPFIVSGGTSPQIPAIGGSMTFMAAFGDTTQAAAAAEYGFKNIGTSVYIMTESGYAYTEGLAAYFKDSFVSYGGTITAEATYASSDVSASNPATFASHIDNIKALPARPAFFYIAANPAAIGPIVKQFRDAGLTEPILGGDGYDTTDLITQGGSGATKVFFTTHGLLSAEVGSTAVKNFIGQYREKFSAAPDNIFAVLGYDALNILLRGIERAEATDGPAIRKALEATVNFQAITGSTSYSDQSHIPKKGVTVIEVKNGTFEQVAEFVPEKIPNPR